VKRLWCGGPLETRDSKGIVLARVRRRGLVAKANDIATIEAGIASANSA
jgi:hypothetical protein